MNEGLIFTYDLSNQKIWVRASGESKTNKMEEIFVKHWE